MKESESDFRGRRGSNERRRAVYSPARRSAKFPSPSRNSAEIRAEIAFRATARLSSSDYELMTLMLARGATFRTKDYIDIFMRLRITPRAQGSSSPRRSTLATRHSIVRRPDTILQDCFGIDRTERAVTRYKATIELCRECRQQRKLDRGLCSRCPSPVSRLSLAGTAPSRVPSQRRERSTSCEAELRAPNAEQAGTPGPGGKGCRPQR